MTHSIPRWSTLFLSEVDGFYDDRSALTSAHCCYRHYPGVGSVPMMFAVHRRLGRCINFVSWRGRCGAVHLIQRNATNSLAFNIFCIGVHGAHGDLLPDTIADLAFLMKSRPFGSQVVILGDWNVDMLPTLCSDPWGDVPGRSQHHLDQRIIFDAFVEQFHLDLCLPSDFNSVPGGPFAEFCFQVPITRIPIGEQAIRCLPSLIDFGVGSRGFLTQCSLFWEGVPADHALIGLTCIPVFERRAAAKTRWKCTDDDVCKNWIASKKVPALQTLDSLHCFLAECQLQCADTRTCSERRQERLPMQLRDLYARMSSCTTEQDRHVLQRLAWERVRKLHLDRRTLAERRAVGSGRVLVKSKKLHSVKELILSDGSRTNQQDRWNPEVLQQFGTKWGHKNLHKRSIILDYLASAENDAIDLDVETLLGACSSLRQRSKLDPYGISLKAVRLFCAAQPEIAVDFFKRAMSSSPFLAAFNIQGRLYGKESSTTAAADLRAILPLPSILQVIDVLISTKLTAYIDRLFPPLDGCFIGARPFTQPLDIAHGLQAVLEKGLDDKSRGAIAQQDIAKYYDSIDCLLVVKWLESRGVPKSICAAALRQQLLPKVILNTGTVSVPVTNRCIGALTGSRVAGVLGRVPVESTISERRSYWQPWGYRTDHCVLTACTFVDNIFSAGRNLDGAINILEDFEMHLRSVWRLDIKSSSRSCCVPLGSDDAPDDADKWPLRPSFTVLGHILQDNGATKLCWHNTRRSMWRAFFGNYRKSLRPKSSLQLLQRAVIPCLDFRNTRWPAHADLSLKMDTVQRKMIAIILRPQMRAGETPEFFVRRRNRLAAAEARSMGTWSHRHCKRVLSWRDHLLRPANSHSWAAILLNFHGFEWLLQKRSENQGGLLAGRTGTRAASGNVFTRWHDGLVYAAKQLDTPDGS